MLAGLPVGQTVCARAARQCGPPVARAEDGTFAVHVLAVVRLVPVEPCVLVEQLGRALVGRNRGEDPPQTRADGESPGVAELLLLHAHGHVYEALVLLLTQGREEHLIQQHAVADDRDEHRGVVHRGREQRLDEERDALPAGDPRHDVQQRRHPHDRVDQERQRRTPDEQVVRQVLRHTHLTHRPDGPARLHEEGLDEPLEPPTLLVLGLLQGPRRLLERDGVDHLDLEAAALEPRREIGVLGDVVRVPDVRDGDHLVVSPELQRTVLPIDPPEGGRQEVVAGATERRDQAQTGQTRQHPPEVDDVLGPVERVGLATPRVPELEHPLHAGDAPVTDRVVVERRDSLEELHGLGPVLEVPDEQALTRDHVHGVVARLGLGARTDVRHLDQFHVRGQGVLANHAQRVHIVFVDDEQHLQLVGRVHDATDALHDQPEARSALFPHGNEHAVGRQGRVVTVSDVQVRETESPAGERHDDLEPDEHHVERGDQRSDELAECGRARDGAVQDGGHSEHSEQDFLPAGEEDLGGLILATAGTVGTALCHGGHTLL